MRTGIDIDGVIYPWHYSLARYFREFKGYEGNETDFWDYFETLPESTQNYYVNIPIHYRDQSLTEDAIKYLPKLAELGEIFYITSRHPDLEHLTRKFFDEYEVPFKENLIFEKDKSNLVRLLGIDYFVDDQPKYLEQMRGITRPYLFLQPHNSRGNGREEFDCISSLRQLYEIIKETTEKK